VKQSVAFGISEAFVDYHDIFVRNSFNNWKDVLREVAYSPMMAKNLSYLRSKSMAYVRETLDQLSFADENFAREVSRTHSLLCTFYDLLFNSQHCCFNRSLSVNPT